MNEDSDYNFEIADTFVECAETFVFPLTATVCFD